VYSIFKLIVIGGFSMNGKILIIEDESKIRSIVRDFFNHEGFEVIEAENGKIGLEKFEENKIDLVLLDIMMPELDGWSVCRRIRKNSDIPIVMMTARGDEEDQLMGYELEADDYIVKPFSPSILVAKCKILLKRSKGELLDNNINIVRGSIQIKRDARSVFVEGKQLNLTYKEYELLNYMIKNEGLALTRDVILREVWGYDFFGDDRVVDSHIKKLRKHLGNQSCLIKTIFGVGYKFEVIL